MRKIIGAKINLNKNSNGKWVASGELISEEGGRSIFCEGIGSEYGSRVEARKMVKDWLLRTYSLGTNFAFNDFCEECGENLQSSQYAKLKKEGESTTTTEDDLVCRNYPICKEAEKEIE